MNYVIYTPKQANRQTQVSFLLRCRHSLFVFLLLIMVQISTATVPGFQIHSPNVCERGAVIFNRSGNFGMKWTWDVTPPTIDSVRYIGTHHFENRNIGGTVFYSYSQTFDVTTTNITNCGTLSRCAYVPFGDVLSSSQMSSVIQNLEPNTYHAYWWSDYTWQQFFPLQLPINGSNQEGDLSLQLIMLFSLRTM
jgi:hypothetical protein